MAIDEQRLKDLLRNIETGDIPEDIPDSEDYDDMGGIKSLDRGAPSIKLASETAEEELQLELGTVYQEFLDAVKDGYSGSFDDYAKDYFTKKQAMENRKMAMNGGRMKYADGMKPDAMANPAVVTEIENMREDRIMNPNIEDVADYKSYYKKLKQLEELKPVGNIEGASRPKPELTPSLVERLKKMLSKNKEEKVKKAKGGIAGVL
jgi:hypothetical protein